MEIYLTDKENEKIKLDIEAECEDFFEKQDPINLEEFEKEFNKNSNFIERVNIYSDKFNDLSKRTLAIISELNPETDFVFDSKEIIFQKTQDYFDFMKYGEIANKDLFKIETDDYSWDGSDEDFFYFGYSTYNNILDKNEREDIKKCVEIINAYQGNFGNYNLKIEAKEINNILEIEKNEPEIKNQMLLGDDFVMSCSNKLLSEIRFDKEKNKNLIENIPEKYKKYDLDFYGCHIVDDINDTRIEFSENASEKRIDFFYDKYIYNFKFNDYFEVSMVSEEKDKETEIKILKAMEKTLKNLKEYNKTKNLENLIDSLDNKIETLSKQNQKENIEKKFNKVKNIKFDR